MPSDPAVLCDGIVRIFESRTGRVHALRGVDAVVPTGELTAITGPSGSGKSSLLRICAALDRPTAGRAEVAGQPLAGMSTLRLRSVRRRHIGYVHARPNKNLSPHLTAHEHLRLAARFRRLRRAGPRLDGGLEGIERHTGRKRDPRYLPSVVGLTRHPAVRGAIGVLPVERGGALLGLVTGHTRMLRARNGGSATPRTRRPADPAAPTARTRPT